MAERREAVRFIQLTVAQREALQALADGVEHDAHSGRTDEVVQEGETARVNAVASYNLVDLDLAAVRFGPERFGRRDPFFTITDEGRKVLATKPRFG